MLPRDGMDLCLKVIQPPYSSPSALYPIYLSTPDATARRYRDAQHSRKKLIIEVVAISGQLRTSRVGSGCTLPE